MERIFKTMALCTLLAAPLAEAATPFEGELPIELGRYFVIGSVWYADLPPDFPAFVLPDALQVMGSMSQGGRKQVMLATTLEREEAEEALAAALVSRQGWMRMPEPESIRPGGFITRKMPAATRVPQTLVLCHDSYGMLHIDGRYLDEVVSMNLSELPRTGSRPANCEQQTLMQEQVLASTRQGMRQYLPTLEVPGDSFRPSARILRNASGLVENIVETEGVFTVPRSSVRRLDRNFTRQMRRQGWKRDSRWNGKLSAGSNWTLETEAGQQVSAFLSVVKLADTEYEVSLKLLAAEE